MAHFLKAVTQLSPIRAKYKNYLILKTDIKFGMAH